MHRKYSGKRKQQGWKTGSRDRDWHDFVNMYLYLRFRFAVVAESTGLLVGWIYF